MRIETWSCERCGTPYLIWTSELPLPGPDEIETKRSAHRC